MPYSPPISASDFYKRHKQIGPYIHRTPILTSSYFDEQSGARIYFKCENFQRMGAFKMRGAASAMVALPEEQLANGVVTHSSGNFAQAVALSAQKMNIPAYIVMPENAPEVKKAAVRGYGGQITECESTIEDREANAARLVEKHGATFLHPSNDLDVIVGQGTAAVELLEEYGDLDYILTPVGGGGLVAGACLATHFHSSDCQVIGAEPRMADDAYQSLAAGELLRPKNGHTVADGLRTYLGDINFPIIKNLIKEILLVEEEEIISAMKDVWQRMKIIIEPSCAVPLAAVLANKSLFEGKRVGIILSGGNVDLSNLPF